MGLVVIGTLVVGAEVVGALGEGVLGGRPIDLVVGHLQPTSKSNHPNHESLSPECSKAKTSCSVPGISSPDSSTCSTFEWATT